MTAMASQSHNRKRGKTPTQGCVASQLIPVEQIGLHTRTISSIGKFPTANLLHKRVRRLIVWFDDFLDRPCTVDGVAPPEHTSHESSGCEPSQHTLLQGSHTSSGMEYSWDRLSATRPSSHEYEPAAKATCNSWPHTDDHGISGSLCTRCDRDTGAQMQNQCAAG